MSLIDSTYFVNDINIPLGTNNTVTQQIARYERDILIQLLGYDLAKLVIAYNSSTSPQRIKELVEGKEYTEGDYTVKWNGLINSEKVSLLAYYVYIQYAKGTASPLMNVGTVKPAIEGGAVVSPAGKIQEAGYKLRELAGYECQDILAASLYNFMMNQLSTYPEWLFNEFVPYNAFGI